MAVTSSDSIKALLKVYYKDGVENLLSRNSPVLRKIQKTRVEGKSYNFAAVYGRGGACASSFLKAQALAATVGKNAEFAVEPGNLWSVYTMNANEILASKTQRGAYMKVAGNKMFASSEALRKQLAASLYGRGFGELCFVDANVATLTSGTAADITLPDHAIMAIDVGTELVIKATVASTSTIVKLTVNSINGNTVNVTPSANYTMTATDVVCFEGSMDGSGNPNAPVGLGGWLPVVADRTGATWGTYIGASFFGVNRSAASDRLAGAFYKESSSTAKKVDAVQALLRQVRRQGSAADMIVLNDKDWLDISKEIEASNTYFTQTSTKGKKTATVGFDGFAASFSTNFIENVYDDPYCPEGVFYILDSSAIEFVAITGTEKVNDGIADNEAGKADPMADNDNGYENDPYKLVIDDMISITPGTATIDGPAMDVSLHVCGSFAVTNPSVCGVGLFYGAAVVGESA